jgi:hypothetical protein
MKSTVPKSLVIATSLLIVAVGLAISTGFVKTNIHVANSKLQNPIQLSQQPSDLAEKIERINAKYILFLKKGLQDKSQFFPVGVYFGKVNVDGNDLGEKKSNFGQEVKTIHAAVLKGYQVEINLPD